MADVAPDNAFVSLMRSTGFFETRMPKKVRIGDMRWGVLNRSLQLGVSVALLAQMFAGHTYERLMPASGVLTELWMDTSGIVSNMETAADSAYCKTPSKYSHAWVGFDYCDPTKASGASNRFWCETDIACEFIDPSYVTDKHTPSDFWVFTYLKRRSARFVPCAAAGTNESDACAVGELYDKLGQLCQCTKSKNSFVAGAEGASIGFRHKPYLDSDPTYFRRANNGQLATRIVAEVIDPSTGEFLREQEIKIIPPGDLIALSVAEMIQWIGLNDIDSPDPELAGGPSLRLSGISFDLRLLYSGSVSAVANDRRPSATLKIVPSFGWQSRTEITHVDDEQYLGVGSGPAGYEEAQTHDTYSVFPRGVHMRITFGGTIGDIDFLYLITQLSALIIYIGLAAIVTETCVKFLLGYKSRVYRESIGEVVTVANVHAKKGTQALIAATAFNKLRQDAAQRADEAATGGAFWRHTVIDELTSAGMAHEEAVGLSQVVAPYGFLHFDKFADRASTQSQLSNATIAEMELKTTNAVPPAPVATEEPVATGQLPVATEEPLPVATG